MEEVILSQPGKSFSTPQLSPDGKWLLVTGSSRSEKEKIDNPIGTITPSATALRWANRDKEMLIKAIELIKELEWCGSEKNAFTLRNFSTIKKLYANYGDEVKVKLLDNCKGAVFYESKVVPIKSNAELYDMLSAEISK